MPKRLTLEDVQKTAEERGGKCLSDEYKNAREKLLWECELGHTWWATTGNVRSRGSWCPECAGVSGNSIKDAKELARSRGGKCLSDAYVNNRTHLLWECGKGHTWEANWHSVSNAETWCPHCAGNVPLTLEAMQELADSRGGKCLSSEYVNVDTHLEWECSEGHTFQATPDNVKRGRLAIEEGFSQRDTLKMPLSNLSPRDHEPIFVFQK